MPKRLSTGGLYLNRNSPLSRGLAEAIVWNGRQGKNYAGSLQPVLVGSPTVGSGQAGLGVYASSGTNYAKLVSAYNAVNADFTVFLTWTPVSYGDYAVLFEKGALGGNAPSREIAIFLSNATGDINYSGVGGVVGGIVGSTGMLPGATYDFAITRIGSTTQTYVNGRKLADGQSTSTATTAVANADWYFGYNPSTGGANPNAVYHRFYFWRRGLTPTDIRALSLDPWPGTLQSATRSRRAFKSSGGTTYNDTIADAVTGAESFASRLTAIGTTSDAATAADSNATTQTMPNALADSVTAAEGSAASQVMPNPITDDVTGGEAFGTAATFNSALSDGATASDSVEGSVSTTYNETIADSVTAADAMEGELPQTGDTHDGFVRRTRRQRAMDAAERKRRDDAVAEAVALRLEIEAAMGMAAEAAEDAPPAAAEALQDATEAARPIPAVLVRAPDYAALEAARMTIAVLHQAIAEAARAKALADDDEDVEILLRAL